MYGIKYTVRLLKKSKKRSEFSLNLFVCGSLCYGPVYAILIAGGMEMIRLIATDLDGTLLNDQKQLPPDFGQVLEALRERGIRFVAASGRSRQALRYVFGDRLDEMTLICDNGAFWVEEGQNTFRSDLDPKDVAAVDAAALKLGPRVRAILCGTKHTYIRDFSDSAELTARLALSYRDYETYTDPAAIDDAIFKIAVCDMAGAGQHAYPALREQFENRLRVVWSGPVFLDIMNPGVDKGSALKAMQKKWNIAREETMAFGDFYNDVELLNAAYYSFLVANAEADMAPHGRYRAASNNACGVTRAIRRYVLEEKQLPAPGSAWTD